MQFHKLSGAGNDFIAFDNRDGLLPPESERPAWLNRLCRRGEGVGADGVLILENSERADVRQRYHNADGYEAEMCGNGLRCLVRFAHLMGALGTEGTVETIAGIHQVTVVNDLDTRVSITDPVDMRHGIAMEHGGVTYDAIIMNTGVPHVTIELPSRDALDSLDLDPVGRALRHHPAVMPAGANINFFIREDERLLRMRTYERGVEAETLACGTGAVSCCMNALLTHGGESESFTVITRSGLELKIHLHRDGDRLTDTFLEGPAVVVYRGELTPDFQP